MSDRVSTQVGDSFRRKHHESSQWWFRIVSVIYLFLGISWAPPIHANWMVGGMPGFDAPIGGVAYRGLLDYTFIFGLELLVMGAFLLYASRQPGHYLWFVWLIVALEIVRGILGDVYMIVNGYETAFYIGFIILHLLIIGTGIAFVRQARGETQ
ncbi:MAG TPA: BphX family protein [Caldilineae bacterium]|nr:BphX family protein [Caldilineae bacterium]